MPLPIPPTLLPPLRLALHLAPQRPLSLLLAAFINHLLRGQSITPRLAALDGCRISLYITDFGQDLRFRIRGTTVTSGWEPGAGSWDVRIRGSFDDFRLMATRAEDPDTLFFQRRLAIEGNTETGLLLKNLLDALDYDWRAHVDTVLAPLTAFLAPRRPSGR